MTYPEYYKLEGKTPVPTTWEGWLEWMEKQDDGKMGVRRVAWGGEDDGVHVSTVFLGLDHRFGDEGPPMLFETMIFKGEHDEWQERCSTWEEAEAMHKRACELAGIAP